MFTLHIEPPLSYGARSTELLADMLDYSPRITFSLPYYHQSDFTVVYLMHLQAAKQRRHQRSRNTLSCPMNYEFFNLNKMANRLEIEVKQARAERILNNIADASH